MLGEATGVAADVLIVGAGPTGLALAALLQRAVCHCRSAHAVDEGEERLADVGVVDETAEGLRAGAFREDRDWLVH